MDRKRHAWHCDGYEIKDHHFWRVERRLLTHVEHPNLMENLGD